MNNISKRVHLSALAIMLAGSLLIWRNQHAHRRSMEARLRLVRSNVDTTRSEIAAAAAKAASLREAIEQSSKDVQARIAFLAHERSERLKQVQSKEPVTHAELPYRWDDAANSARIGKRALTSLGLDPIQVTDDGRFQLDERAVTLLSLTPAEVTGVQSAIDNLVAQQRTIERKHLLITPGILKPEDQWMVADHPDLVLSFSLPALPDEGKPIEAAFRSSLEQSIGPSRSEMLLAMAASELQMYFGDFGQQPRWVTFRERLEPDGMLMFAQSEGTDGGATSSMSTTINPEQFATAHVTPIPAGWRDLITGHYYRGMSLDLRNNN